MARCVFIVQGEGRGHMSQAMAVKEFLDEAGHTLGAVFLGGRPGHEVPDYFSRAFEGRLHTFQSPRFLRTPNQKGIYVGRTLLFNVLRIPVYISELYRIRREIGLLGPDVVFNFYDVVGALALRRVSPGIRRIGIGHHFLLHLENYYCNNGQAWHKWLLKRLTKQVLKSCDKVLALSYREVPGDKLIEVAPPLVRHSFRELSHNKGKRYLAYFLNEGLLYELILLARECPEFQVDLFTSLRPAMELPEGMDLHPYDAEKFKACLASCRGLICSAGFDAAAEAAYHGISLVVIPTRNHFEQACNAEDIVRSGIGIAVTNLNRSMLEQMQPGDAESFRAWTDSAGERLLKCMKK